MRKINCILAKAMIRGYMIARNIPQEQIENMFKLLEPEAYEYTLLQNT